MGLYKETNLGTRSYCEAGGGIFSARNFIEIRYFRECTLTGDQLGREYILLLHQDCSFLKHKLGKMFHYMRIFLPHKGCILFVMNLVHNLQGSTVKNKRLCQKNLQFLRHGSTSESCKIVE